MKPSIIVAYLCILLISFGCKKDNLEKPVNYKIAVQGSWELRTTSAAMIPGAQAYPPGNGNVLKFNNSRYEKYVNGALTQSGHFAIISDLTAEENVCLVMPAGLYTKRIIYDGNFNGEKTFIQLTGNNKLDFISGCYALDAGHSSEYEKQ
jgi:hypothetical protein